MKIGILGGTFNPIHTGHLMLAQEALCKLGLDKVVFVPTFMPPHKTQKVIDAKHRYNMVSMAIKENPALEVSKIEISSPKKSYSIHTLRKFKLLYGSKAKLFFIAGSDLLDELYTWKNIKEIFKLANENLPRCFAFFFNKFILPIF